MSLISLSGVWISFSDVPLLDNTALHIERNERVCLVGRNGAGKSTLLKIVGKELSLDDGRIVYEQGIVVARLQQDPPRNITGTVFDYVSEGLKEQATLIKTYHQLSHQIEQDPSERNLNQLAIVQQELDHQGGWLVDSKIRSMLELLALDGDAALSSLSGGWLRKAALAQALVSDPQVLLLDEPTNHLDIEMIAWLELFLRNFQGSIVFISHDRSFIRQMATRIVDLDRGKLVSWPGDYDQYLLSKEEALRVEELQNAEFDRRLAQEEIWIRQGIKARRTRNEGRVKLLKIMRSERAARREVVGTARMQVEESIRSGKIVVELENISYYIADRCLVNDFSIQLQRGDKIALIGPNGCGKTTLINLMLQKIAPSSGSVHIGTKLDIAYFDQHRAKLDPEKTVVDNLAEGKQEVMVNGRSRHVLGYLQDFLFHPKRAMTPVKALSGGERNRLLLAQLFLKPSNLLILDEPTNDLDIETLELLEELINDYSGTVLLVSHDRQFVDNTVTHCWIFEGNGQIIPYVGGYHDAHQQQAQAASCPLVTEKTPVMKSQQNKTNNKQQVSDKTANKLNYKQQRELEQLPKTLIELEESLTALQQQISAEGFFNQPHNLTQPVVNALSAVEFELEQTFTRWEQLESLKTVNIQ